MAKTILKKKIAAGRFTLHDIRLSAWLRDQARTEDELNTAEPRSRPTPRWPSAQRRREVREKGQPLDSRRPSLAAHVQERPRPHCTAREPGPQMPSAGAGA